MKKGKINTKQLVDILNDDNIQIKGIRTIDDNNFSIDFDIEDDDEYYCDLIDANTSIVPDKYNDHQRFIDQDKYIDEDLLKMRTFEEDFDQDYKKGMYLARLNNQSIVEKMTNEMADVYKSHLSTILEYNTQQLFHGLQGLRAQMSDYVRSLVTRK